MESTVSFGRVRGKAVLVAVAIGSLAACSTGESGTATTRAYQPLDPGNMQLIEVEVGKDTIGVAPDLSATVVVADGKTCLVPRDAAEPDTAAQGTETQGTETQSTETQGTAAQGTDEPSTGDQGTVCADLPDGVQPVSASFAPSGERYALFPDVQRFDTSGAWIVQSATGAVTPIAISGDLSPTGPAGSGSEPPESGSEPESSRPEPSSTESTADPDARLRNLLQGGVWLSNSELIGFSTQEVLRIDASTGEGESLYVAADQLVWMYAAGGHSAAVLTEAELIPIDLETGEISAPITVADKGARATLLGVSPDGTTALVSQSDPRTFESGPTVLVSLEDGKQTAVDVPDGNMVYAGSFSPDGSQIVLFDFGAAPDWADDNSSSEGTEGTEGADSTPGTEGTPGTEATDNDDDGRRKTQIQLLAADGTGLRTIGSTDALTYGPMLWSSSDVLIGDPHFARPLTAWQLSAGN